MEHRADLEIHRLHAPERPLRPGSDPGEVFLRGGQQCLTLAGAFLGQQRVLADHQPLAGG
jgi:hypothetical protein